MVESFTDAALELNRRYSTFLNSKKEFTKGEKSKFFLGIINNLYSKYGERLLYPEFYGNKEINLHNFKRKIRIAQIELSILKKEKNSNNDEDYLEVTQKEEYNAFFSRSEGNTMHTYWEVKDLGLNENSYF